GNKAVALMPQDADALRNLGRAYYGAKRFPEAVTVFEKIARAEPPTAEAQNNLGNAYYQAKRLQEAVSAYKAAISIRPNHGSAHFGLAVSYATLGDKKGFTQEYTILKQLDPKLAAELARLVTK